MNSIAICIPTFKRLAMLEYLINSILNLQYSLASIRKIIIIIADNDKDTSAKNIADKILVPNNDIFEIIYFCHPKKGLSGIRNELMQKAFSLDVELLAFIDDDEYVSEKWLIELLTSLEANKSDAVMGPVIADIRSNTSPYIKPWFKRRSYKNNTRMHQIASGNILFKIESLKRWDIWFDNRFNISGGEDFYFGIQILKKGAVVVWADQAIAYEFIPKNRATVRWLIKRRLRGATTYTYILLLEKQFVRLFKKTFLSIAYILIGTLGLLLLFSPIQKKFWGLLKISEGFGGLAGIFTFRYKEYK